MKKANLNLMLNVDKGLDICIIMYIVYYKNG